MTTTNEKKPIHMLATKINVLKEIKNKVFQMSNSTTFQNTLNLL